MAPILQSYLIYGKLTKKTRFLNAKALIKIFLSLLISVFSFTNSRAQCNISLTPANIHEPTCGGNDGSFSVQVTGISAPYQYTLYKDVSGSYVQQETGTLIAGTPTFVFLYGGTYKVVISQNGCVAETVVALSQASLSLTPTNLHYPTCGGEDGSFSVQATGITAPYQYTLYKEVGGNYVQEENGTLIAGNPTFVFLSGGTYKLAVSKNNVCSGETIIELPQASLSLTPTNLHYPTCGGEDGSFSVQASGITPPYQYILYKEVGGNYVQEEAGTLIAGNPTFVFLSGGTYKLAVSKNNMCSGETIVELPQAELSLTPTNLHYPTCGGEDGSFSVQATGITAPYQYTLYKEVGGNYVQEETGTLIAGNPTFVFLSGGTYKLAVSKNNMCSGETIVELPQQNLTLTTSNIQQPSCGGSDGYFSVQASGITAPYQYTMSKQINGSFVQQETGTLIAGSPTFIGLSAGTYQLTVSKGGTCTQSINVYLNCETIGKQGCGSGYWKNNLSAWTTTNFSPNQTAESVFNVPDAFGLDDTTLVEILQSGGGSTLAGTALILLRAATTALLNAYHPEVNYPLTVSQIISSVNAALLGNKSGMQSLIKTLDKYNNSKCPLDAINAITSRPERQSSLAEPPFISAFNVKAYPNPTSGAFTVQIQSPSDEKVSISVLDMQGRLIEKRERLSSNQTLSMGEHYIPGFYLIDIQQGKNRQQIKLIKATN